MNINKIRLGVEIECIIDHKKFLELSKGNTGNFYFKGDGSLRSSYILKNETPIEIINKKPLSPRKLKRFLEIFKNKINAPLNESLYFNKSCGLHYHISFNDAHDIHKHITLKTLKKVRERFFKLIRESDVLNERDKENILNHYARKYAVLNRKKDGEFLNVYYGKNLNKLCAYKKYYEFNFHSEFKNQGLEWRSINALGLDTWEKFFNLNDIVIECVYYLCALLQQPQKDATVLKIDYSGLDFEELNKIYCEV